MATQQLQETTLADIVKSHLLDAATALGIPHDDVLLRRILKPEARREFEIPIRFPDGTEKDTVPAYVVIDRRHFSPSKGGMRIASDVTMDTVEGLAADMTYKFALVEIPFGGAKAGIRFDRNDPWYQSLNPLERAAVEYLLAQDFADKLSKEGFHGEFGFVTAPDLGSNKFHMGAIYRYFQREHSHEGPTAAFVTGKPIEYRGLVGREEATAQGLVYLLEEAITTGFVPSLDGDLRGKTVVIQGFGNVGGNAARLLEEEGAKIIGVSDASAYLLNEEGIDIKQLTKWTTDNGNAIKGYSGATEIDEETFYKIPTDIFIPAARELLIDGERGSIMRTKLLAEAANGPLYPEAERELLDQGTIILPDLLANVGGGIVSYYEWLKGRSVRRFGDDSNVVDELRHYTRQAVRNGISEEERQRLLALMNDLEILEKGVDKRKKERDRVRINLRNRMRDGLHYVRTFSHEHGVTSRIAAYAVGLSRVFTNLDNPRYELGRINGHK